MQNSEVKKESKFKTFLKMVWIFIQATVIPRYAYRFRNMYLFLPILLLIISWCLVPIPIQHYLQNNGRSEYYSQNINNVDTLYDLSDEEFAKIKAIDIRFDLKVMYADDENFVDAKEIIVSNNGNKYYIVVDLCDVDSKASDPHYDFSNFFDTYRNEEGSNTLLVFYADKYLVRTNAKSNYYYYQDDTVKLADMSKEEFANFIVDGMIDSNLTTYSWYAALYCLLIPVVLALFSFLILKVNAKMKKFRNYLNVAGIASVVPTLLVFIFSWILPQLSLITWYAPIYIVYFFFFIGFINYKREKVSKVSK